MFYIEELNAISIRNFDSFCIRPSAKLNFFYGPNASGKTTILESVYLLSRVKSFRSKRISNVIKNGEGKLQVFAKGINQEKGFSIGLEKGRGLTKIKFNREMVQTASELARHLPVYVLTPDHYVLFTGTPKERRHWLDWSMFHVEQNYLQVWKSYHRALRHRNALLKLERSLDPSEITGWEELMAKEAKKLDSMRNRYVLGLNELLNSKHVPLVLSGSVEIKYQNDTYDKGGLYKLLIDKRDEDIKRGYTSVGPHRSDIIFNFEDLNVAKYLSRGQTKLFGAALISSQIEIMKRAGFESIVLVDDLDAELDEESSMKMLNLLLANNIQTFVSSLTKPDWINPDNNEHSVFHVKHGKIQKMVE